MGINKRTYHIFDIWITAMGIAAAKLEELSPRVKLRVVEPHHERQGHRRPKRHRAQTNRRHLETAGAETIVVHRTLPVRITFAALRDGRSPAVVCGRAPRSLHAVRVSCLFRWNPGTAAVVRGSAHR